LLGQIEVGGRYGIVLERLPGVSPPPPTPHHTLREIVSTLNALHKDRELAALIGGASCPARDAILQYHIPMCDDDLDSIEPALPLPFVDRAMGTWMRAETASLRSKALQSAAFDELVTSPIHGDLWFGNVLVQGDAWWIIDWDDLKIGDPVHDLSLILFPSLGSAHSAEAWLGARDAAFMERFDLYTRAALLTFVIDPLADWIEAESFPEVRDAARAHREQLHRWALERYVELYGE
jgi:hypothetical protein